MNVKLLILLVSGFSLIGCTSIRPIDMEAVELNEVLETGDRIVAYEKQGRVVDMTLIRIEDDVLVGSLTNSGLTTVRVNIADIEKIEAERISGAKTTGAVVGGLVLVPLIAVGAVLFGFAAAAGS